MIFHGLILQLLAVLLVVWDRASDECASLRFLIWFAVGAFSTLISYGGILLQGDTYAFSLTLPAFFGTADIVVDPFAAFMGSIFAFGSALGLGYGHFYLKKHPGMGIRSHLFFTGLMLLSMQLVLILRHSLLFMLAWELMSLASFFAILQDRESEQTRNNALYYFVMMHIGAAVLLLGFAMLYRQSGSYNFGSSTIYGAAKWLLLIGFAFKAGFFPFYSWLPKAHPVAPAHLSGMMSGLMIKTGIFGIIMVLGRAEWQPSELYLLLGISVLTAFNGVIHALAETNIKKALAYSSIENIGIIGVGLSLWLLGRYYDNGLMSTLGMIGALLHLLNHSLFKPLLFYLSGNVLVASHNLEQDKLGGLGNRMPRTALLFLLGTGAISALPLLNGFISELCIFLGLISGFSATNSFLTIAVVISGALFAFVSALALIAFTKVFNIVFSGEPRSSRAAQAKEVPFSMLLSPGILAGLCLLLGIFAPFGLYVISPLGVSFSLNASVILALYANLFKVSIVMGLLLLIFGVMYWLKSHLSTISRHGTWACAYPLLNNRMQYTGSAYINPLAYFLKPFMHKKADKQRVEGYFPHQVDYHEEVKDYLDDSIGRLSKLILRLYRMFDGIHNGKTNSYISFLLLALILLLLWALGVNR